jgi:hypothetical protein
LLWAHPAHEFTEASCVDAADLLNQDDSYCAQDAEPYV